MVRVVDRGDRRAAARARLALAAVDLERHRHLVGDRRRRRSRRRCRSPAPRTRERACRRSTSSRLELGALAEWGEPAPPRGSRPPRSGRCRRSCAGRGAAGAGAGAGRGSRRATRWTAPARPPGRASRPSRRPSRSPASSSFAQARCLVPNSRSRSSRPSAKRIEDPGALVAQRGALVEQLQPPRRHHVDEQSQLGPRRRANSTTGILPDPADAVEVDRRSRRGAA